MLLVGWVVTFALFELVNGLPLLFGAQFPPYPSFWLETFGGFGLELGSAFYCSLSIVPANFFVLAAQETAHEIRTQLQGLRQFQLKDIRAKCQTEAEKKALRELEEHIGTMCGRLTAHTQCIPTAASCALSSESSRLALLCVCCRCRWTEDWLDISEIGRQATKNEKVYINRGASIEREAREPTKRSK